MTTRITAQVTASPDVLFRDVGGEAVLLNLDSETYFGLDAVGTRMWQVLTTSPSLAAAHATLLTEYTVTPELLEHDLIELVDRLVAHGLLVVSDGAA